MKNQDLKKIISKLPDSPGVYIFRGLSEQRVGVGKVLYIGKATSLKDRVRSYFSKDISVTRSPLIVKMLSFFDNIDFVKTDSVLEALVLEASLIKKYQPEANIQEKDDRSFNFVVITKEEFPKVLIARGRELLKNNPHNIKYSFGPFPYGGQLKEALKIVRKMFPYRDKCNPAHSNITSRDTDFFNKTKSFGKNRACFNRQIGLCPGVCTGEISKEDYQKQIENIVLFFEGNKKKVIKNLEKEMESFSHSQEYENANRVKKTIFTLKHIQDVSLIKDSSTLLRAGDPTFRIESYDIAHMSGQNVVGVMTVVENGETKLSDYRKFKIRWFDKLTTSNPSRNNDTKALREILTRRLAHIEWKFPDLIVVDGGLAQKRSMEKILMENKHRIPVVSVVKDERHRPREILGDKKWLKYEREIILSNSEAHRFAIGFHKQLRRKIL